MSGFVPHSMRRSTADSDRWWEFAEGIDEIVREEIGEPAIDIAGSKPSVNDGSQAVLQDVADEIARTTARMPELELLGR
jgi:hypothetical protein